MIVPNTLAFDGGATRTRAGLYDSTGACLCEAVGPPCNPIAYGEERCLRVLADLAAELAGGPARQVCAAISGANSVALRRRLAESLTQQVRAARVIVSDDVWPLLAANAGQGPAILVLAGTGATVLGQAGDGPWARAGGRGPLLGDEGGAYPIAVAGLHAAAHAVDGISGPSSLPDALVAKTGAEGFEALPAWCAQAGKDAIAGLATIVLAFAEHGDAGARDAVQGQAESLARHVDAVARRLRLPETGAILLHGGLFEKSAYYAHAVTTALQALGVVQPIRPVTYNGHAAVFRYAAMAEEAPPEARSILVTT